MRVALVTNALDQPTRGNHTTVQRWLHNVTDVELQAVPPDAEQEIEAVPDLFHGYHALHGGLVARALAHRYRRPYVVSLGGTDLYACLRGGVDGDTVSGVLLDAACVTGAFESFGAVLSEHLRRDIPFAHIPRGVRVPADALPHRCNGELAALLPAGLRPDKDPLLAIEFAEALNRRGIPLRLRILGPELDGSYAYRVRARAAGLENVEMGEIPWSLMPNAYAAADVVWNTSFHEGGANALLEAVAHGCAVLARDAPGNRDFAAEDGSVVHIFAQRDLDDVEAFHRRLIEETETERTARIQAGHAWLRALHNPKDEARRLRELWVSVAG